MKDETASVAIDEFVGLSPKKNFFFFFLVNDSSEHKKANGVNKNAIKAIIRNEYEDILFNKKCLKHLINRIQSKDHRIGTYEISRISLSWIDYKIYIQNSGYDQLALGYWSLLYKNKLSS